MQSIVNWLVSHVSLETLINKIENIVTYAETLIERKVAELTSLLDAKLAIEKDVAMASAELEKIKKFSEKLKTLFE